MLAEALSIMNTPRLLLLPVALFCGSLTAVAQFAPPVYEPMKLIQTESPVFPHQALVLGLRNGEVRMAIQVDADGALTDYVVTAYSHPAFADAAVAAIKKWKYVPARIHGLTRSATADLNFKFEAEGVVVVDLTVLTISELIHYRMVPNAMAYSACTLGQLDRTPTPIKIVRPDYPEALARTSHGGHVVVEFYIDEQGRVRLPSVDRQTIEANGELAAAAVTAVEQWQFEPPTMNGKPVLTLAQQDIAFKPSQH
jgi:TonB family protein